MKNLMTACSVFVMGVGLATTSFAEGTVEPPPTETCYDCPEEPQPKGNNGWGNGPDTTNSGSFSGGTAGTKSVNGLGPDKFDGKFDGR